MNRNRSKLKKQNRDHSKSSYCIRFSYVAKCCVFQSEEMTVDWVDVDKDCANSSLYLTTYVNDIFEHYRRREVGVLMFLSTVSVTLPYLTFGVTVIMLATVSAEALLSYGPMSFPVHRALA